MERAGSAQEISSRDFLRVMLRHKWKAFCFVTMTMLVAAAYAFYFPKSYRSEAKLFVKLGRENAGLDATTTLGQTPSVAVPIGREEEINTEVEILGTDSLLLKVVDKIGPPAIIAQTDGSPSPKQRCAGDCTAPRLGRHDHGKLVATPWTGDHVGPSRARP